jgi:integrase
MPRPRHRRPKGEGSVYYSKGDRTWIAKVPVGRADGRPVYARRRAATSAEAEIKRRALLRSTASGIRTASLPLDRYLQSWMIDYGPSIAPGTRVAYEGHIRLYINPLLGSLRVGDLTHEDVRRLVRHVLDTGKRPATVHRVVATLRSALAQAVSDRTIPDNPAANLRLPRIVREPIPAMSRQDVLCLREAVRGDTWEALYVLLLGSGLRIGEACALDWRDVDFETGVLHVRRSKSKVRTVPLPRFVQDELAAHRAATTRIGPDDPVFTGTRRPRRGGSGRLRRDVAHHHWKRLLASRGLRPMRLHDLRHGTATRLLAHGVPMRVIADQLGHANPSLTARLYAHVVPEMQREAVLALDEDLV